MLLEGSSRPEAVVAIDAVERGLELALSRVGAGDVTSKGGRDLVTATDIAVEDMVRGIVGDLPFPVVGEERGGDAPLDGSAYWLLDPICGTRNFASGIPLYCVNLALVEGDQVALAVIGDASTGAIHVAERGRGAWISERDVRRQLVTSPKSQVIIIEHGHPTAARREHAARFASDAIRADRWDVRNLSTTLSLPYVAAGRVAAYVLFASTPLHTAAGTLVVTEAGGTISDIEGRPWTLRSDSIVAGADPDLHTDLIHLTRAAIGPSTEA
jgi:myo-inositol-1(or 4)-monophosphatase